MKRKPLKAIALAAAIVLMVSVTACGGSSGPVNDDAGTSEAEDQVEKKEDAGDDGAEPETEDDESSETAETASTGPKVQPKGKAGAPGKVNDSGAETKTEDYKNKTLEEAFADPKVRAELDEALGSADMNGVSYQVIGNDFIMSYILEGITIDGDDTLADALSETLEAALEEAAGTFESMAAAWDEALGQENTTTVFVRYYDDAGILVFEKSFKAP